MQWWMRDDLLLLPRCRRRRVLDHERFGIDGVGSERVDVLVVVEPCVLRSDDLLARGQHQSVLGDPDRRRVLTDALRAGESLAGTRPRRGSLGEITW